MPWCLAESPFYDARRGRFSSNQLDPVLMVGCQQWFVPLPVAAVVYLFGMTHPFGDVMLFCIPLFLLIPVIGAIIGSRIRGTDGGVGEAPSRRHAEESGLACLNQLTPIARTEKS
jgi:hypothetical protein